MTDSQALPLPRKASPQNRLVHSLYQQMQAVQWWSADKLLRNQLLEVAKLLRHVREFSPLYAQRLRHLDLDRFDLQQLRSIEPLTRAELSAGGEQIDCVHVPEAHGSLTSTMTSGSTGTPVSVRTTGLVAAVWSASSLRDHFWHRRRAGYSNAAMRWQADNRGMGPEGITSSEWGSPYREFFRTGPGYFLNSATPIEVQVDWLLRRDPHYLISHPSNLRAVLYQLLERGQRPQRLQQLRTVGEALPEDLRQLARQAVSVPLVDMYSSQELGYIALQCPDFLHYHVQSENLLLEVVDAAGDPCSPGQVGRVLVTSLRNFATPLIRYEIGDYAEVGPACACGRGLPVLRRIMGRVRNMLKLPDGSSRWPNLGFRELAQAVPMRQFQLVQLARDHLEFRLIPVADLEPGQAARLQEILGRYLDFPFRIDIRVCTELPRSASGKYEDFLCLVED